MKRELIAQLFESLERAVYTHKGLECWSARELQWLLGYTEWRNFVNVIFKAVEACESAGFRRSDHFVDVNKMISASTP